MLSGLLVLDLTAYLPGPYATQLLADFGARVIKVEPLHGEPARHMPPHGEGGVSATFQALNAGKESLALDLKQPEGARLLLELAARADALIEGFRPGVMERLGLGPEVCHARNPGLVYCRVTGFGQDGPYRDRAGHDLTYQAYSGALSLGTDRAGFPAVPGVQSADLLGALSATCGLLMALVARARDGRGRVVDASLLEAVTCAQGLHFVAHAAGQRAAARRMPLNGGFPCYDVYRARCGRHVVLAALEPKFWDAFCEVVSREDWLPRAFDPTLRPELDALFAERDRDEWRVILENVECCFAPVLDYDEARADEQLSARGMFEAERLAPPVRFEPPGRAPARPAPGGVGEHGRALLGELLGLDAAELDRLQAARVLGA
ncbi:MAG: CaiB/BaiF CoA transferase family protein [Planctomycetota bacterium]